MTTAQSFSDSAAFLAVDIGGTKTEVGVVSDDRVLLHRVRAATPERDVWSTVSRLVGDCQEWARKNSVGVVACGVGCGGPMNLAARTVSPLHIPEWREFRLLDNIAALTGLTTYVDNDAKALVRAEWWYRTLTSHKVPRAMMSVVMGTGVGAGIIIDGRLVHGRTGNAGHIGHIIVEPDGNRCECGAIGCLEAHISGRALSRVTNGRPDLASAASRADVAGWLGVAIASAAAAVDLADVTLGGSVALGFGQSLCDGAQAVAREHAGLSMIRNVSVALVADGHDAPLFGAAGLAKYPSPYEPDVFA